LAGEHRRGRTRAGRVQAALGQQAVEPDPGHGRHKVTVIHFTVAGSGWRDDVLAMFRRLSLTEHGLLELLTGLALIGAPLVLGLGLVPLTAGIGAGALIAGLALADDMPLSTHMAADMAIGGLLLGAAVALAAAGEPVAATLLALGAAAELALSASTRWTRPVP
jgi:hypothetical protein